MGQPLIDISGFTPEQKEKLLELYASIDHAWVFSEIGSTCQASIVDALNTFIELFGGDDILINE